MKDEVNQMAVLEPRPYLLVNKIRHYPWGTKGEDAFIPCLLGIEAQPGIPYAELWIGAHDTAPSDVVRKYSLEPLNQLISESPSEILGEATCRNFQDTLPFLLKVLSVGEALSLQVHPNKDQAKSLNETDPNHYPDSNHKPELAIALDFLTALVGFKSFDEILCTLEEYREIASFIGNEVCQELKDLQNPSCSKQQDAVRSMYSTMVVRSENCEDKLMEVLGQLDRRFKESAYIRPKGEEELFRDLRKKYTGADVGLLSIFFLNLIQLKKGQWIYIKPGTPHAYLRGNIVECMANSDNVVRIGLTPKYRDAQTLAKILDYELGPPIPEDTSSSETFTYKIPGVSEFQVARWKLGTDAERSKTIESKLRILLITEGEICISWCVGSERKKEIFQRGQSILIPAFLKCCTITAKDSAELFTVEIPKVPASE
ncbi:mannose-6-phosphate isomerase, class I [Candidatus Poribacteria bacterium]